MPKRRTGNFTTRDEAGMAVSVQVWTDLHGVGDSESPGGVIGGGKELVTDDGLAVTRLGKGRYWIFHTGDILTSDDPEAL
jgi:hypothetical protein